MISVAEAVASRRSIRAFTDAPVPLEVIQRVLDQARMAPSGCNFQPWEAVVLTGAPLKALQERLLASQIDSPLEYDFSAPQAEPRYRDRMVDLGAAMYSAIGVQRADASSRQDFTQRNLVSFDALFPHMTVAENVAFGLEMQGVAAAERATRVRETLELVGLGAFTTRFPRQLSGGQQQRVALARALVIRPQILLLDEPLSNLDAKLREGMQIELRQIQRTVGTTTILVTHDQAEAMTMSDGIAVMNDGRLAQLGAPREIYDRPAYEAARAALDPNGLFPDLYDKLGRVD